MKLRKFWKYVTKKIILGKNKKPLYLSNSFKTVFSILSNNNFKNNLNTKCSDGLVYVRLCLKSENYILII